uniref:Uncharacterized protein n=1 Tax=Anopheles dirus TaxID=7168 RepID=A0A182N1H2_9DIPT
MVASDARQLHVRARRTTDTASPAMDQYFEEMLARAVLAYLIDEDMYLLAEHLCLESPYLKAEHQTLLDGGIPVNYLRLSLREIVRDFTKMQAQMLRLVNLCSEAVVMPNDKSVLVQVDHLLEVLKECGTAQTLDQIIATMQPFTYTISPGPVAVGTAEADTSTGLMQPPNVPDTHLTMNANEGPVFYLAPTPLTDPPAVDNQPVPSRTILSTTYAGCQPAPVPPHTKPTAPKPDAGGGGGGSVRSSATPLDTHPILAGAGSSRSTSSQKRSHIRILDFSTPALARNNPSASVAAHGSARRALLSTTTQTDAPPATGNRTAPAEAHEPKPKKRATRRRSYGRYRRRLVARRTAGGQTTLRVARAACGQSARRPASSTDNGRKAGKAKPLDLSNKSNDSSTRTGPPSMTKQQAGSGGRLAAYSPSQQPPTASTKATGEGAITNTATFTAACALTGSPGCPVDPLVVYPMTPRFLNRPLQVLGTLSPLLATLDSTVAPATSGGGPPGGSGQRVGNGPHPLRQMPDINTPSYPITPGCTITPSPPPDGGTPYYEPQDPGPPQDEPPDGGILYVRYRERTPGRESDRPAPAPPPPPAVSHAQQLAAARFEIVCDGRVFQVTNTPLIELHEQRPLERTEPARTQ